MNGQLFKESFCHLTCGLVPHPYQSELARLLLEREHDHVLVRAPTGAGKTLAVIAPFLLARQHLGATGLIYVLPLRTLVEAVETEPSRLAEAAKKITGRSIEVKAQTGERPDAPFFTEAEIFVTTFDQFLSGLLCEPYGLPDKLKNINAAALAGKLVVFDEFHLMGPAEAFTTALFGVALFRSMCRSVWMTATATSALTERLSAQLSTCEVKLSEEELSGMFEGRGIRRALRLHLDGPLMAEHVLAHEDQRILAVVNQVRRAQELFEDVRRSGRECLLLHSRFFADDRRQKQARLREWFSHSRDGVVISTQVIEAGVDLSAEVLLTELSPVNSIVQRAGRCARFANQSGTIHVFGLPSADTRPYTPAQLEAAKQTIHQTEALTPSLCTTWVEEAHGKADGEALRGFADGARRRREHVSGRVIRGEPRGAANYIRPSEDNLRVYVLADPRGIEPGQRQAIQLYRNAVKQFHEHAWFYDPPTSTKDIDLAFAVALPPTVASYTKELGLRLGVAGNSYQPQRIPLREGD